MQYSTIVLMSVKLKYFFSHFKWEHKRVVVSGEHAVKSDRSIEETSLVFQAGTAKNMSFS